MTAGPIERARAILAHTPSTTYPSRVAAQQVRDVLAAVLALVDETPLEPPICRQSNHPFDESEAICSRCGGARPPAGPFVYTIVDVRDEITTVVGTAATERTIKGSCSRALRRLTANDTLTAGRLHPGVFATINAPDGRRWVGSPNSIGYPNWVEVLDAAEKVSEP